MKLIVVREENPNEEMSTMGCRTVNGYDVNFKDSFRNNVMSIINKGEICDNYSSGALKDGRGNIAPTTIVLPTLAMKAKEIFVSEYDDNIVDVFIEILDKKINEAKDSLIERFEWIASQSPKAASFMYENNTMAGYDGKDIRSALKHGTLAIGMLGLAETLQILIGKNHTTEEGMELAKRICKLYKDKCSEYKEKYKLNFGAYYTPKQYWVA